MSQLSPSSRPIAPLLVALVLASLGCATGPTRSGDPAAATDGVRSFAIIGVNDVYRIEGVDAGAYGGLARLRTVREELERTHPDLLVLLAGDFLYPSLLSRVYDGAQMVDVLGCLDGDCDAFDPRFFVTFGNHEFDREDREDAWMLQERIEESGFRWINSNVVFAKSEDGKPLVESEHMVDSVLVEAGGVRIGIFGLTIDSEQPGYVERILTPWTVARERTAALREAGAEVVIGLTHLDMATDVAILDSLGAAGPDLIFGGHEHNKQFEKVGDRWVVKADAEARTAAVLEVTVPRRGAPRIGVEFRELGPGVDEDPEIRTRVADWLVRHDETFCVEELEMQAGCLDDELGSSAVRLEAEELEIRMFETNLGSWVTDLALEAFRPWGAQVAFVNAGSLRLNQDVPPGPVTRRHLEELFQYPTGLKLMRLTGAELHAAVRHAVDNWGYGNGYFLQIAGFAYRHDPMSDDAGDLTLLGPEGPRPIRPDEEILAVTGDFLAHEATGQDGFTMLREAAIVPLDAYPIRLRDLTVAALEAAGEEGIAPEVDGRICNTLRADALCLALPASPTAGEPPPAP